jgi:mycothiol system anti-sigma-R factor
MTEVRVIDCEEALHRLFEYLDAELDRPSQRAIEQHLERCRSCFSRLEFEKRLKGHTSALGTEPVSPQLEARIRRILDNFRC